MQPNVSLSQFSVHVWLTTGAGSALSSRLSVRIGRMAEYRQSAHAVFDLKYHMIWCTKYRKKVLRERNSREAEIASCKPTITSAVYSLSQATWTPNRFCDWRTPRAKSLTRITP